MKIKNLLCFTLITLSIVNSQTADQIKQAKEIIQRTGMSENQARAAAKAQGFTDKQIDDAIDRELSKKKGQEKIETSKNNSESVSGIENQSEKNPKFLEESSSFYESNQPNQNEELQIIIQEELDIIDELNNPMKALNSEDSDISYFGYQIFKKDPALFQNSSAGAVDPDYLIGPGDEIIVMLWGETQFRQVLEVNREGFIFIPEIGQVFVNGLNLSLLESKLFRVFSQAYASLNPEGRKATTFLDLSLGNLRPLRIQVLGELGQPGAYTVSPSTTLFSALYYFNGPSTLGSLRDIRLIRGNKEIASIDFYDYLLTGKKPKDEKLQLDDIIFIPKRKKTVSIQGEINRPGIYELVPGEDLSDIISISRGLKITAYLDRIQIDRVVPFDKREKLGMDRMFIDLNIGEILNSEKVFELNDGDKIHVFSVLEARQNTVSITGAITRPGTYDLGESLKLSELIIKADNIMGDAYLDRADVIRMRSDLTEELIQVNLLKALNGDLEDDIKLKSLDRVKVYSTNDMIQKTYVSISGHVKNPGRYLLQKNMTLFDLIFKGGGYVDEEFKKLTYLKRAELVRFSNNSKEKEIIPFDLELVLDEKDIAFELLRPGDAITIYSKAEIEGVTRFVSIEGHVKRPGTYELYESNMTIYDLIFKAGGFDDKVFKSNTFLERADLIRYDGDRIGQSIIQFNLGSVLEDKNSELNLTLKPGDQIKIYSKYVFNNSKDVTITGVVKQPGNYKHKTGMTLEDILFEAGGVYEDVYKYKIEIARINPDLLSEDIYAESFIINEDNIEKYNLNSKNKNLDFKLMPYDYISIRPDPFFNKQKIINISGEVYYPGDYAILSPKETITSIIERSGGLKPDAYAFGSRFIRDNKEIQVDLRKIIKKPKSKDNIFVLDGDKIEIRSKPNTIQIKGEINAPGYYKFKSSSRIKNVIEEAGGLTQNAEVDDIFITYANGKSKKYSRYFGNAKVFDGSVITIGRKPEEEPFDKTEYFKELTSIIANLAQALSLIILANGGV